MPRFEEILARMVDMARRMDVPNRQARVMRRPFPCRGEVSDIVLCC